MDAAAHRGNADPKRLGDRTIWNVNSTAVGGGVAEMLQVLVGLRRGPGDRDPLAVIGGDPEFFAITKRLHNQIHGLAGDGRHARRGGRRPLRADARAPTRTSCSSAVRPGESCCCMTRRPPGLAAPLARRAPGWCGAATSAWTGQNDADRARRGTSCGRTWPPRARPTSSPAGSTSRRGCPAAQAVDHPAVDRPVLGEEPGTRRRHGARDPGHHRACWTAARARRRRDFARRDGTSGEVTQRRGGDAARAARARPIRSWSRSRAGTGSRTCPASCAASPSYVAPAGDGYLMLVGPDGQRGQRRPRGRRRPRRVPGAVARPARRGPRRGYCWSPCRWTTSRRTRRWSTRSSGTPR